LNVAVVHPGTQHALHEACGLASLGHDVSLVTRLAVSPGERSALGRVVARRYPLRVVPCAGVRLQRLRVPEEVVAVLGHRLLPTVAWRGLFRWLHARFGREAARRLATQRPDVVIGFDTACRELFHGVAQRVPDAIRVLEATTLPPALLLDLLEKAAVRFPAWRTTIDVTSHHHDAALARDEARAAQVITVGSDFAASSYRAMSLPGTDVVVTPYGCDFAQSAGLPAADRRGWLFCGRTNLQKGLPDLLSVAHRLPDGEPLHIVGPTPPAELLASFALHAVEFHGRLTPGVVRGLMQRVRATVLPSYGEGGGRVLGEALSQGCPVIASRNTGGPSLVAASPALAPSVAIVEPGQPDQLLEAMASAHRLTAGELLPVWTWTDYARSLLGAIAVRRPSS